MQARERSWHSRVVVHGRLHQTVCQCSGQGEDPHRLRCTSFGVSCAFAGTGSLAWSLNGQRPSVRPHSCGRRCTTVQLLLPLVWRGTTAPSTRCPRGLTHASQAPTLALVPSCALHVPRGSTRPCLPRRRARRVLSVGMAPSLGWRPLSAVVCVPPGGMVRRLACRVWAARVRVHLGMCALRDRGWPPLATLAGTARGRRRAPRAHLVPRTRCWDR